MYAHGRGVVQDDAGAVRWYRLAAEQEDGDAQHSLRFLYVSGSGATEDDAEAVRWCRLAAEQGEASAQWELGMAYRTDCGVAQDYVLAHMWFNLAASRFTGVRREDAVLMRDEIAIQLTPDELSEAQRLAREWDAAHPR